MAAQPSASASDASALEALEQRVESLLARIEAASRHADTVVASTRPQDLTTEPHPADDDQLDEPASALEASIDSAIADAKAKATQLAESMEQSIAEEAGEALTQESPQTEEPEAEPRPAETLEHEASAQHDSNGEAPAAGADSISNTGDVPAQVSPAEMVDQAGADVVEAMFGTSREVEPSSLPDAEPGEAPIAATAHAPESPAEHEPSGHATPTPADAPTPDAAAQEPAASSEIAAAPSQVQTQPSAPETAPAVAIAKPVVVRGPREHQAPPSTPEVRPEGPSSLAKISIILTRPFTALAGLVALPLRAMSVEVRDLVGWFALITLFNAACLWGFVLWKNAGGGKPSAPHAAVTATLENESHAAPPAADTPAHESPSGAH